MAWKHYVALPAIVPRRRVISTALLYGLSLAVRFTSATGEEMEVSPQAIQSVSPAKSIIFNDGPQLFSDWPLKPAQPIGSPRWLLDPRSCRSGL